MSKAREWFYGSYDLQTFILGKMMFSDTLVRRMSKLTRKSTASSHGDQPEF